MTKLTVSTASARRQRYVQALLEQASEWLREEQEWNGWMHEASVTTNKHGDLILDTQHKY